MNSKKVDEVEQLCRKLLQQIADVRDETPNWEQWILVCGDSKTGKLRRVSLDLSSALAEMRKPF